MTGRLSAASRHRRCESTPAVPLSPPLSDIRPALASFPPPVTASALHHPAGQYRATHPRTVTSPGTTRKPAPTQTPPPPPHGRSAVSPPPFSSAPCCERSSPARLTGTQRT